MVWTGPPPQQRSAEPAAYLTARILDRSWLVAVGVFGVVRGVVSGLGRVEARVSCGFGLSALGVGVRRA